MGVILTVLLSVVPPILFLIWILRFDRIEPEPFASVLKVLLLGCFSVFPVAIIETYLLAMPFFSTGGLLGAGLQSFLVIAPAEEIAKLLVVLLFVWRSRHFNESNDGIVYAGTASIGFALAENLFYVFEHGLGVGIARAVTSIPGHTFTGVLMGYYVGRAKFASTPGERFSGVMKGLILAWLLHGAYDTFVLSGTSAALLVVPLVALNFIVGIKLLKKGRAMSEEHWNKTLPEKTETQPSKGGCKLVLGRILLILSGLFWLLIILGLIFGMEDIEHDVITVLSGTFMITAIPLAAGILLELSSRKGVRKHG